MRQPAGDDKGEEGKVMFWCGVIDKAATDKGIGIEFLLTTSQDEHPGSRGSRGCKFSWWCSGVCVVVCVVVWWVCIW